MNTPAIAQILAHMACDERVVHHCQNGKHTIQGFPFTVVGCGNDDLIQKILYFYEFLPSITVSCRASLKEGVLRAVIRATRLVEITPKTCRFIIFSAREAGVNSRTLEALVSYGGDLAIFDAEDVPEKHREVTRRARIVLWYQTYTFLLEYNSPELL